MASGRDVFLKIIREIADGEKLECGIFSDGWGIRLSNGEKTGFIVGYQFPLNNAAAKELCQDKCLTYEAMLDAGIPAVPHFFLSWIDYRDRNETAALSALKAYLASDHVAVVKNNYGTGGHQVYRVTEEAEADEAFENIFSKVYGASVSPFVDIFEEYRVVMLDGRARLTIRKERESEIVDGKKVYKTWKHNLGQGATGVPVTDPSLKQRLHRLAKRAAAAANVRFASVDLVDTADGLKVLEINGGVMLEHYASQSSAGYDQVKALYKAAILHYFGGRND